MCISISSLSTATQQPCGLQPDLTVISADYNKPISPLYTRLQAQLKMNQLVQARLNKVTTTMLDRFAADNSLNRSDALRMLILRTGEQNKLIERFEKIEASLVYFCDASASKNVSNKFEISIENRLELIQKVIQILIENVYLPAAPMDRKSAIRVAAEILKTDY